MFGYLGVWGNLRRQQKTLIIFYAFGGLGVIGLPDIRLHFAALLMDMILDGHSHLSLVDGKWISEPRKKSSRRRRAVV